MELLAFHVARGRVDGRSLARDELHDKKSARARACPITDSRFARSAGRCFRSAATAIAVSSTAASSVSAWHAGRRRVVPTAVIGKATKDETTTAMLSAPAVLAARPAWGITVPRS